MSESMKVIIVYYPPHSSRRKGYTIRVSLFGSGKNRGKVIRNKPFLHLLPKIVQHGPFYSILNVFNAKFHRATWIDKRRPG